MRIDKTYRPELLDDECYVDAKAGRLIAASARGMISLPVSVAHRERSGTVSVAGMRAARVRHPRDPQATLRSVRAPAPKMPAVPEFRRGEVGTVTLIVNVGELKRLSDALGVVSVAITGQCPSASLVVQPVDRDALEFGVLFGEREASKPAKKQRRQRQSLDGRADEILEDAGDRHLLTRAIG